MEINEDLLRKYIIQNVLLRNHCESTAESYLDDDYNDDEEINNDMKITLEISQKIIETEEEIMKELNKYNELTYYC